MNQTVKNLIENYEEYIEVIDEMIAEIKCKDCDGNYKACRFCRLEILDDLKENLLKLAEEAE